jgi:hypothetical protein
MSLWLVLTLIGFIKLVVAALMLWLPFRWDTAMYAVDDEPRSGSDDEGGSRVPQGTRAEPHPKLPRPHRPRRGPHGSPSPLPPARVRTVTRCIVARAPARH